MRKLLSFLAGIVLLSIMIAALGLVAAIYDAHRDTTVQPYFFQPGALSQRRVDIPLTPQEMGDDTIRNMLVYKYVNEYFYVVPDEKDIAQRISGHYANGLGTPLWGLSSNTAFRYWLDNQSEKIRELAARKVMRIVNVTNITVGATGHLIVDYELKTWFTANDMYETPTITKGRIYLNVRYTPGVKETSETLHRLENGTDAASAFNFKVLDVEQE